MKTITYDVLPANGMWRGYVFVNGKLKDNRRFATEAEAETWCVCLQSQLEREVKER